MSATPTPPPVRARVLVALVASGLIAVVLIAGSALLIARRGQPRTVTGDDYPALRAKLDGNPKALYVFDEATSYRLKPLYTGYRWGTGNSPHQTNSRGLLGAAEIDASPGVRKVLFLGDSVTYGDAVDFDKVFVSRMQAMAGPGWQLLNAGTPGWSTHQELQFYDRYMQDVPWRAVVLVFCLNDLVKFEWVYTNEREFHMSDEMAALGGLHELNATARGVKLMARREGFRRKASTAALAELNNSTLRAWDAGDWRAFGEEILEPWLARRRSLPLLIVIAPLREQLKALAAGGVRDEVLWPQRQMQALCTRAGVRCVDPIDDLIASGTAAEADELFRDDLHLTELGHERLAGILWPRLEAFAGPASSTDTAPSEGSR